jgi:hypothetical protein
MKKPKDNGQADSQTALAKPETDTQPAKVRKTGPQTIQVTMSKSLDEMLSDICTPTGTRHDEAAMFFMAHATRDDQTFQGRDANVLRATRLMRLHLDQIEAMQKLKGKAGQQKVTVEHVHVHEGGQAIVGAVRTGRDREGGGDETENR